MFQWHRTTFATLAGTSQPLQVHYMAHYALYIDLFTFILNLQDTNTNSARSIKDINLNMFTNIVATVAGQKKKFLRRLCTSDNDRIRYLRLHRGGKLGQTLPNKRTLIYMSTWDWIPQRIELNSIYINNNNNATCIYIMWHGAFSNGRKTASNKSMMSNKLNDYVRHICYVLLIWLLLWQELALKNWITVKATIQVLFYIFKQRTLHLNPLIITPNGVNHLDHTFSFKEALWFCLWFLCKLTLNNFQMN